MVAQTAPQIHAITQDTLGGPGLAARSGWIRPGGRVVVVGYVAGTSTELDLPNWLLDDVAVPLAVYPEDGVDELVAVDDGVAAPLAEEPVDGADEPGEPGQCGFRASRSRLSPTGQRDLVACRGARFQRRARQAQVKVQGRVQRGEYQGRSG